MTECFVSLGGNIGDTFEIMTHTVLSIATIQGVSALCTSRPYVTSPVSPYPQRNFLNAVCRFHTHLTPQALFSNLEEVEQKMGKTPKPKSAPRVIDIDLLFYGKMTYHSQRLVIPHPLWHTRLFVLAPLSELIGKDFFIDVSGLLKNLQVESTEKIEPLDEVLPYYNR